VLCIFRLKVSAGSIVISGGSVVLQEGRSKKEKARRGKISFSV